METLRRFAAILVADLRERTRATRFWVILAIVGAATWMCFPAVDSGKIAVGIDDARGLYSSAWSGLTLALMYSTMLAWLGFYLVRGTLVRDFDTRVWQLLVATPMTRPGYLLAKWASHMTVFSLVLLIGLGVGMVAQWVRAEDRHFDLVEMFTPVLVLTLPALSLTAFFAIVFDMVPALRRTGGNVLYFFVWLLLFAALAISMNPEAPGWARTTALSDPSGITLVQRELRETLPVIAPGLDASNISVGLNMVDGPIRTFRWTQRSFDGAVLAGRMLWVLLSLIGTALLAPFLDAAARHTSTGDLASQRPGRRLRWLDKVLRHLESRPRGLLLASELRLALRQRRGWWWATLAVCWVAQCVAPVDAMAAAAIVAWMISVDLFGRSLLRERETRTSDLVMTAPRAAAQLLFARTSATLVLVLFSVLPALLRLALTAPASAATLLLIATNVALLGLALAALCRSSRPYELGMVMMAYMGVQGMGPLSLTAASSQMLVAHLLLAPVCLALLALCGPPVERHDGWTFPPARRPRPPSSPACAKS